jgi:trk system potassium uptake protein TrkH
LTDTNSRNRASASTGSGSAQIFLKRGQNDGWLKIREIPKFHDLRMSRMANRLGGGSAGSTGGGIKVVRHLLLFKNSLLEFKRQVHPQAVLPVRMNGKPVSQDIIFNVLAFFLIYFIIFAIGTFVMSLMGLDFETAIGSTIATLGNIGPGIGHVGPVDNYYAIPSVGKWFLSFLMLLGRLELFTVLILFSPAFWKR